MLKNIRMARIIHESWRRTRGDVPALREMRSGELKDINVTFEELPLKWQWKNVSAANNILRAVLSRETRTLGNLDIRLPPDEIQRRRDLFRFAQAIVNQKIDMGKSESAHFKADRQLLEFFSRDR